MQPVQRKSILDFVTYEEQRAAIRARVLAVKALRRIHVGPHLTFLFENQDTVRYQVQEMVRAERIVKEADIQHELDTYNDLLGGQGELGATLLIEIDDEALRAELLQAWIELPAHVYVGVHKAQTGASAPGAKAKPVLERVRSRYDERQVGRGRLSSVQYLKFDLGGRIPCAVGCDLPAYEHETVLTPGQMEALRADLA